MQQHADLQYDELGVLPAVKHLPHDKLVVAGNAIVSHWFRLLLGREVICLNVLHVNNGRYKAQLQM